MSDDRLAGWETVLHGYPPTDATSIGLQLIREVRRLRAEAAAALESGVVEPACVACVGLVELRAERDALRDQIERGGCAASRIGETTYECQAHAPCGLCRLRAERDALRADLAIAVDAWEGLREDHRTRDALDQDPVAAFIRARHGL
jgi:hypothetical protein